MLANNNDLFILLIGLLVLLLIVVLIAASKSKSNKNPGGGGLKGSPGGTGTDGSGGSSGAGGSGGGGIYIDASLRENDGPEIVERKIPEDSDSGHDIVRIYADRHRPGLIVCPNCDAENLREASRCAACGYIL